MSNLTELAGEIVLAHASMTSLTTDQLLDEINMVYKTLKGLESGAASPELTKDEQKPTISPKQSIKPNEVICLICGKGGMKTLARHLGTAHNMKPGEYKKQFGIPSKQPLAAKKFSEARRKTALEGGLADNLAKARAVRAGKVAERKANVPAVKVKASVPAVKRKAAVPSKVDKK
jgi:predicted transcriptional regulator